MAQAINVPVSVQVQNNRQLTQQVQASLNAVRLNLGNGGRALSSLSQPLGRLTGQADEFSKSMEAANARVLAFGASVGIVNAFSNAFKSLVASTIEVEKAIKAITVVGEQFNGKTKELSQGLFNVAKTTGQSFAEVSKAALEFSRQGLGVEDTLQRTQDALILTRLTGLDAAKAVEGLTAAANGFTKAGLSTTQILNKLAAVDQAFAVSSADLIEGFNRSAAVAENAGVSFDELAGIITALQQKTSRGGAVIGNALKTIFTRLQDTNTLNQLEGLGIAVEDLQGNLLPARQILQNLAKDVQGLGKITKAGIFKDVAGTFQINQLISLVDDLNNKNSVAADATKKAAGATNEAFVANEKLNQSLDAIINKVALTGKQLGSLIGEIGLADSFKSILDSLNGFLEGASDLLQGDDLGSRFAKGIVKGIGAVLTGPGFIVILAGIAKLSADFIKFGIQGVKTFFNIGRAAKEQQQVQESIVQTLLRNENVLRSILNTQGGQNAQAQTFLTILNQQEQALQNIRSLAGGIAAPVIAGGYGVGPQGGIQRRGRAAGGYLPAQEAADVRRGVGGASPNSKVVAIPNFAFGGGKRGTMIANTSEYIVPNYAGGGSAIFNQDMVKTMGLPAGAKKISAAGGYIPNFANYVYDSDRLGSGKNEILQAILDSTATKNLLVGPAGAGKSTAAAGLGTFIKSIDDVRKASSFTILSAAGLSKEGGFSTNFQNILNAVKESGGKTTYLGVTNEELKRRRASRTASEGDLRSQAQLAGTAYAPLNQSSFIKKLKRESLDFELLKSKSSSNEIDVSRKYALITNKASDTAKNQIFPYKRKDGTIAYYKANIYGLDPSKFTSSGSANIYKKRFSAEKLEERYKRLAIKDAKNFSEKAIGLPISPVSIQNLTNSGSVPSVVGTIFETAIESILTDEELQKRFRDGGQNALFDFVNTPKIGQFFGIEGNIPYLEAKSTASKDARKSFAGKIDALESGRVVIKGNEASKPKKASGATSKIRSESDVLRILNSTSAQKGNFNFVIPEGFEGRVSAESIQKLINAGGIRASGGYIPNFANSNFNGNGRVDPSDGIFARLRNTAKKYAPTAAPIIEQVLQNLLGLPEGVEVMKTVEACVQAMTVLKEEDKINEKLRKIASEKRQTKRREFLSGRSSSGFIPSFAASALQQAIAREKSAGLSSSQIYVDKNPALKSASNPMGLMVANTRDEPGGGFQGIVRARREGANPKTYGAANGFVPNYAAANRSLMGAAQRARGQRLSPSASSTGNSQTQPLSDLDERSQEVASGLGDVAGKIIVLQSALSFLTAAVGDGETSMEKFTQQLAQSSGNITSLGFLFKEIAGTETKTKLGGFVKNLGLVGTVAAGVYEGFKLFSFAINEFSGQNKRNADALAQLEGAAQKAAITLEDFSPEKQIQLKEVGTSALKSFQGSFLNILNEAAGKNPEILKQAGQLAAQGSKSPSEFRKLLENKILETAAKEQGYATASDYTKIEGEKASGTEYTATPLSELVTIETVVKAFKEISSSPEFIKSSSQSAQIREGLKAGIFGEKPSATSIASQIFSGGEGPYTKEQLKIAEDLLKVDEDRRNNESFTIQAQRKIALGDQISLDLAKQKLDAILEQKKAALDYNAAAGSEALRLELETLDVSEKRRNEIEKQLKIKEIDNELTKKNIDLVKDSIDRLSALPSEAKLGVSAETTNKIQEYLSEQNITNAEDLKNAVIKISETFGLTSEQVSKVNELLGNSVENAENLAKAQKESVTQAFNFTEKVIDSKNALESARLLTEKIASDLERAAGVRLSFAEVGFNTRENAIKLLRERASATTNTAESRRLNKQALSEERALAEDKRKSELDQLSTEKLKLDQTVIATLGEYQRLLATKNVDSKALQKAKDDYDNANSALVKLSNQQIIAKQNFDNTISSLDLQAQAIYKLTSAWDAYQNTLLQFREGAGERIGAADIGILSATDPTSLATATIQRKVEMEALNKGLQGEDYYKSVIQGTELEKKRFELSTENSKVRKIELERELKLMEDISKISATTDEERLTKIKEIIAARQQETQTFGFGFSQGVADLNDKTQNFKNEIGREIPNLFASNLAQGLNDAISGAKSLKDALRDAATSFLNALTQRNIQNLADMLTGGIGGFFAKKASGGMINGGSGTKDDVPAMLMGGEYVIKKSAVKKYGSKFLDSLNNGGIKAFAAGGGVQSGRGGFYVPGDYGEGAITGKNQLLAFAGQSFTGGQYDRVGVSGMSGASVNLESESARLTAFGRENSPMFERVQQAKEEAFNVYLNQLKQEQQYRQQLKEISKADSERKKQLQRAIIGAVVSSAVNVAGSSFGAGFSNAYKSSTGSVLTRLGSGVMGGIGRGGVTGQGGLTNLASGNLTSAFNNISSQPIQGYSQKLNYSSGIFNSGVYDYNASSKMYGRRASGGMIIGGSGIRDDVPAMLTGGEFVLNNRATRKLGIENLNRLNSGDVGGSSGNSGQQVSEAIISKLDELIQTTRESSKDNVVVNVSGMEGGEKRSDENKSVADRELQRKIRDAVLAVLAQEKRLGGSLNK